MNLKINAILEAMIVIIPPLAAFIWLFYRMSQVPLTELVDDDELEKRINSKLKFF